MEVRPLFGGGGGGGGGEWPGNEAKQPLTLPDRVQHLHKCDSVLISYPLHYNSYLIVIVGDFMFVFEYIHTWT